MRNEHRKQTSTPLSVRVSQETLGQLEELAKATGRSKSYLAGEAINRYLETEAWQVDSIQKTLNKINRPNGKYVDHNKVSDWLNSWGTDKEQEPPK